MISATVLEHLSQCDQKRSPSFLPLGQSKEVIDAKALLTLLLSTLGMCVLVNSRVLHPQSRIVRVEDQVPPFTWMPAWAFCFEGQLTFINGHPLAPNPTSDCETMRKPTHVTGKALEESRLQVTG